MHVVRAVRDRHGHKWRKQFRHDISLGVVTEGASPQPATPDTLLDAPISGMGLVPAAINQFRRPLS
jgi:hypothetical protein